MSAFALLPEIDVERRFEEAARAGRPEWLWTELPESRWEEAVATIETTLREMLAVGRSDGTLIDDPVALSIACYTSGTGPLLATWLEQKLLTTTAANAEILRIHLDHNRARMTKLTARAQEVVEALAVSGTTPIILKGLHTAHHYFDEPGQRIASDIDLLVRPEELPVAGQSLTELGYTPRKSAYRQRSWMRPGVARQPVALTFVHRDDPWSLDLHESVNLKLAGGTRIVEIDGLIPIVPLDRWQVSPSAAVLPPPFLLVHLLMHASYSFENLTLQRQYEIGLLIRKSGGRESFDWPAFTALCDHADLWPFLYPALHCTQRLSANLFPDPTMQQSRKAAPPTVRKLVEAHSAGSAHSVGRWSLTERYMWADGRLPRLRQLFEELQPAERMNFQGIVSMWRRRIHRQLGRIRRQRHG